MKYHVLLFTDEDGWYVAQCPVMPGCVSQGRTRAEALANIKEAMELWLETWMEDGHEVPQDENYSEIATVEVQISQKAQV